MAKKYARREHVSVRKKREEEQKRQNRKKLTKNQWLMIAAACAVVLAVVLFFVLRTPAGALAIKDGKVVKGAENWIVAKLDNHYFHTANFDLPNGYTRDTEYTVKSDALFDEVYLKADDTAAAVQTAYATTVVNGKMGLEMIDTIKGYYTEMTGPAQLTVNGLTWNYFIGNNSFVENEGDIQRTMTCYLDGANNRYAIALSANTATFAAADAANVPTDEAIIAEATRIVEGVTLPEEK